MGRIQSRQRGNRFLPIRYGQAPSLVKANASGASPNDDLVKRDKVNLDIFWLKDESLEDSANLPAPEVIAVEIVEDLEAALAQFSEIASDLALKESQS